MQTNPFHQSLRQWYVIYTRSFHEKMVYNQLTEKSFELFFPQIEVLRRTKNGQEKKVLAPLFPGYLFIHCYMDIFTRLKILSNKGVVKFLESPENRLIVVPDDEIRALQTVLGVNALFHFYPYLNMGKRVKVVRGPLTGVTGIFHQEESASILVISIQALKKSLAINIDPAHIELLPQEVNPMNSHGSNTLVYHSH